MAESLPEVSVIIPAFNEEKYIATCLDALLPQVRSLSNTGAHCEVLVVDNGSTDRTREICEQRGVSVVAAPLLRVGAVRNVGAAVARGSLLAFLDADCIPRADWLQQVLLSQTAGPCLTGCTYALPDNPHWMEAAWFGTEQAGRRPATHINAGNLVVPTSAFRAVGGFDESLASGEDFELAQRLRPLMPVISDDRIVVRHLGNPKTLRRFLQREIWHGLGALGSARHDLIDLPLLGTLAFIAACGGILAGLPYAVRTGNWGLLSASVTAVLVLLLATVEYRTRLRHGLRLRARLLLLYSLFYIGRSIALGRLLVGASRYVRTK